MLLDRGRLNCCFFPYFVVIVCARVHIQTLTALIERFPSKYNCPSVHGLVGLLQFDVVRFFAVCLQTRRNNEIFCLITFAPVVGLKLQCAALLFTFAFTFLPELWMWMPLLLL